MGSVCSTACVEPDSWCAKDVQQAACPSPRTFQHLEASDSQVLRQESLLSDETDEAHDVFSEDSTGTTCGDLMSKVDSMKSQLSEKSLLVDVGDVVLQRELCSTFKSRVFVASWQGRFVAAKQLKMSEAGDADDDAKFKEMMNDIDIFSKLSHPCLVNMLGASVDRRHPILLTEFLENQDLETYMHKQRKASIDGFWKPRFSLAAQWAIATGEALAYLHGRGIVHRDLKPLNMLLTRNLEVKIGDFGLAKVMPGGCPGSSRDEVPKMSGGVGTWRYMAPEVARYEAYDEKVDIYAFSLILYLIFSGLQPFGSYSKDLTKLLDAYQAGEEPRPSLEVSMGADKLRQLVADAWHVKASERPSAEECLCRLEQIEVHSLKRTLKNWVKRLRGFF